jgi:hypothetical protein
MASIHEKIEADDGSDSNEDYETGEESTTTSLASSIYA